jgi:hypothetical protein
MEAGGAGPTPPGWYNHPHGGVRYWDGAQWGQQSQPPPPPPPQFQHPPPQSQFQQLPPPQPPPFQYQQQQPQAWAPQATPGQLTKPERIWACSAFGAAVIGSIGPWATIGIFSKAGTDGDGVITLVLAIAGIVLALLLRRGARIAVGIVAVLILAIGIFDVADVSSSGTKFFGADINPSVGWGLWVVTLAGAAATLCAFAKRFGLLKSS